MANNSEEDKDVLEKWLPINYRAINLSNNRIMYWLCLFTILFWSTTLFVQSFYCIKYFNSKNLIERLVFCIGGQATLLVLTVTLDMRKKWATLHEKISKEFDFDSKAMAPKLKQKMKTMCRTTEKMFLIDCLFNLMTCVAIQMYVDVNSFKNLMVAELLEMHFPKIFFIYIWTERITVLVLTYGEIMGPYYSFFFHTPAMLKLVQLRWYILEISKRSKSHSKDYDSYVKQNLIYIIKKHNELLSLIRSILSNNARSVMIMSICIIMYILYGYLLIFLPSIWPLIGTWTALLFRVFYFTHGNQQLEDVSEDLCNLLYFSNWYEWNLENQKIFNIILLNTSKKVTIPVTPSIRINHEYFTKFIRIIYSIGSIFRTVSFKKNNL